MRVWADLQPPGSEKDPFARLELRPGNTSSVSGRLIRVAIHKSPPYVSPLPLFASVGWKVVR